MKLSEKQKEILNKYSIPFKYKYSSVEEINDLLDKIDEVMMDNYLDEDDEPLEEFLILEKLYDEIYNFDIDEN